MKGHVLSQLGGFSYKHLFKMHFKISAKLPVCYPPQTINTHSLHLLLKTEASHYKRPTLSFIWGWDIPRDHPWFRCAYVLFCFVLWICLISFLQAVVLSRQTGDFKYKERIYENVRLQQYKLSQILTEKSGVNHVFPFSHWNDETKAAYIAAETSR